MNPIDPGYIRNDNPYLRKRKVRRIAIAVAAFFALAGAILAAALLVPSLLEKPDRGRISRTAALALWETADYAALSAACDATLSDAPLDPYFLALKGMASFYLAVAKPDTDDRAALIEATVVSLRKALVDDECPLRPQVRYVLGKAYFFKGPDYYDETLVELGACIEAGYSPDDIWEYLALSAQGSGQTRRSLSYFNEALSHFPGAPELTLAAARAFADSSEFGRAEALALSAGEATDDEYLDELSDFLLADVYRATKRFDEARARYAAIRERNPESADAWYYDGLVLADIGDAIGARAAWRKAISIDPMHAPARQKLAERS